MREERNLAWLLGFGDGQSRSDGLAGRVRSVFADCGEPDVVVRPVGADPSSAAQVISMALTSVGPATIYGASNSGRLAVGVAAEDMQTREQGVAGVIEALDRWPSRSQRDMAVATLPDGGAFRVLRCRLDTRELQEFDDGSVVAALGFELQWAA